MLVTTPEEVQRLEALYAAASPVFERDPFLVWAIQRGRDIPDEQKVETYRQLMAAGQEG